MEPNVQVIDQKFLGQAEVIASFLVEGPEGYVLVESGPMSVLDQVLAGLKQLGVEPGQVTDLLVSHIHLDHAGAAGWWASQGTRVTVHPRGARHLIDPERLWSSASRIYGERMELLWGSMPAAPEDKVRIVEDFESFEAAGLQFIAHDTPGHARHHHCYQLGDQLFTGDVAGVRLGGRDFLSVPAPPPEFDLPVWRDSLQRIRSLQPCALWLTHFGRVEKVFEHLKELDELLGKAVEAVEKLEGKSDAEAVETYREWDKQRALQAGLSEAEFGFYEKANPVDMSITGIRRFLSKRAEATSG